MSNILFYRDKHNQSTYNNINHFFFYKLSRQYQTIKSMTNSQYNSANQLNGKLIKEVVQHLKFYMYIIAKKKFHFSPK